MSPAHERSDGISRQIMAEFDEKHKKRLSHRPILRVVHARAVVSCEVGYDFVEAYASLPRPDAVLSIRKVALGTLVRARIKALLLLLRNKVSMQQGMNPEASGGDSEGANSVALEVSPSRLA